MKKTFTPLPLKKKDDFVIDRKQLLYTLLIACALLLSMFARAQTTGPSTTQTPLSYTCVNRCWNYICFKRKRFN
jgi:hypothetical protein